MFAFCCGFPLPFHVFKPLYMKKQTCCIVGRLGMYTNLSETYQLKGKPSSWIFQAAPSAFFARSNRRMSRLWAIYHSPWQERCGCGAVVVRSLRAWGQEDDVLLILPTNYQELLVVPEAYGKPESMLVLPPLGVPMKYDTWIFQRPKFLLGSFCCCVRPRHAVSVANMCLR